MVNEGFQWVCQPKAEQIILGVLEDSCRRNAFIQHFSDALYKETSTRLLDWVDHIVLGHADALEKELEEAGFVSQIATQHYRVFHHPGAQLPRVVVKDHDFPVVGVAVAVDSIGDFLMVRGMSGWIEGSYYSHYRQCLVSTENNISLWVVERRGNLTLEPVTEPADHIDRYLRAKEMWQLRPRAMADEEEAMDIAISVAEEIVNMLGQDMAAWAVLEVERAYWQSRNTAGQVQKNRQDRLGMGWANHDHHTFRSSRALFHKLVRLFEILGFHCRERFYAGEEAGWGAQVMENPNCRLILFLDVDLHPHELEIDFVHHPLPELDRHGTIGLWCGLHGDSVLKAGMHHLEAQFMFDALKEDLSAFGVGMMEPFSNFPYLRQAFTKGELWAVEPRRIEALLASRRIDREQAEKFLSYGAVGSHLENLQRREGFKGFNQKNVSFIIKKTDPRSLKI